MSMQESVDIIKAGGRSDEAESVIAYHLVTTRRQRDERKPVSYSVHRIKQLKKAHAIMPLTDFIYRMIDTGGSKNVRCVVSVYRYTVW